MLICVRVSSINCLINEHSSEYQDQKECLNSGDSPGRLWSTFSVYLALFPKKRGFKECIRNAALISRRMTALVNIP